MSPLSTMDHLPRQRPAKKEFNLHISQGDRVVYMVLPTELKTSDGSMEVWFAGEAG